MVAAEIGRGDADQQGAVGVGAVAGEQAHAVGHHAAGLGRGGHHQPARAHAERVGRAAAGGVKDQLVVGRAQARMAGVAAVLGLVDQALRMLDAHARWRRAWPAGCTPRSSSMAKVSRALLPGARTTAGASRLALPGHGHGGHFAVPDQQVVHAGVEADLAAQRDDRLRGYCATMAGRRSLPRWGLFR